ncbi:MAG: hypothetical protein CVV24_09610 [Ignavibacteriae bacterium HGW-Ignavibacteriae-3]|nr:MAG: hypothetical protein CVV24_09610 [Ignavibacteriae bacterium HGW-Ignavibacteriae-3]
MNEKSNQNRNSGHKNSLAENDISLFEQIKMIQSLPDGVIGDFLDCKGKLFLTEYRERYFNHAGQN